MFIKNIVLFLLLTSIVTLSFADEVDNHIYSLGYNYSPRTITMQISSPYFIEGKYYTVQCGIYFINFPARYSFYQNMIYTNFDLTKSEVLVNGVESNSATILFSNEYTNIEFKHLLKHRDPSEGSPDGAIYFGNMPGNMYSCRSFEEYPPKE